MILTLLTYMFTFLIIATTCVLIYFKWAYTYWEGKGIHYVQPEIPYGNVKSTINEEKTTAEAVADVYFEMKAKNQMHAGFYFLHMPAYIPIDVDIIKHILQVDFNHFINRGVYHNEKDDPLSAHLFSIEDQKWKNLRVKLTPTFTSGKMRIMFPIMMDISKELLKTTLEFPEGNKIEIKQLARRFTTDIIGSCAFGIDCNSLDDPDTEFCVQGKRVFTLTNYELARTFAAFTMPNFMRKMGARLLPEVSTEFFWRIIKQNAAHRETNNVQRNDLFQLLLDLKNAKTEDGKENLTFPEFAAQAFVFFVAGYETTSLTLSLCLYELARNEEAQDKLRQEINEVLGRHNGTLTYEAMKEMHYMDRAIRETLRKYPPIPMLNRVCTEDYQIPNSTVTLKKGTMVFIPTHAIHYDPEFYPNPQEFNPDRFTEENINSRPHFTYLPFGEGPRVCIGLRFGVMQTKVGLTTLIQNFKVKINPETQPIKMNPRHFLNLPINPLWLDFEKIF